jgi:hypothetical protein
MYFNPFLDTLIVIVWIFSHAWDAHFWRVCRACVVHSLQMSRTSSAYRKCAGPWITFGQYCTFQGYGGNPSRVPEKDVGENRNYCVIRTALPSLSGCRYNQALLPLHCRNTGPKWRKFKKKPVIRRETLTKQSQEKVPFESAPLNVKTSDDVITVPYVQT